MARRSYSEDFKKNLVAESISSNKSIASIAEEHDLHPNVLRNWRKKYGGDAAVSAKRGRKKAVIASVPEPSDVEEPIDTTETTEMIELYTSTDEDESAAIEITEEAVTDLLAQIIKLADELKSLKKHSPVAIFAENVNVYTEKTK